MELRNLYTFLRIADLGSFTKAAASLGYAQSTVTAQIKQLEEEIGIPLFDHIGRQVYLTSAGKEVVRLANDMYQLDLRIRSLQSGETDQLDGNISIGAPHSVMESNVLPVIPAFREACPYIHTLFHSAVTEPLFDLLRKNELDLIFTMGRGIHAEDCICAATRSVRALFVCSEQHELARKENLTLKDVLAYQVITLGSNTFLQQELYHLSRQNQMPLQSYLQSENISTVVHLTEANLGVAFLPDYTARLAIRRGTPFKILSVSDFKFLFDIQLFYRRNKWVTPQMRIFIDLIRSFWEEQDRDQSADPASERLS